MSENRSPVLIQRPGKAPRTEKVDLGGGNWVEVKVDQTIEDKSTIQQATVTGKITAEQGTKVVNMGSLALGAAPLQTLILMVTRWGGPAFCEVDHDDGKGFLEIPAADHICTPLATTPENLKALLNGPGQKVLEAIEKNNPEANKNGNLENKDGRKN